MFAVGKDFLMPLNTLTLPKEKTASKDRGKSAEKAVKKALELVTAPGFSFKRISDVYSGVRTPVIADYRATCGSRKWYIEVKEVAHDFRLPHGNMSVGQVARLRKAEQTGWEAVVWVHHSGLQLWRKVPLEYLRTRSEGSWVLSNFPLRPLYELVEEMLGLTT
jgi:hypothetical protein